MIQQDILGCLDRSGIVGVTFILSDARTMIFICQFINLLCGLAGLVYDNVTFNNISVMAVRFTGGGKQSTHRKSPTCLKSLTNFYHILLYRVLLYFFQLVGRGLTRVD